jgi:hypothetical protein
VMWRPMRGIADLVERSAMAQQPPKTVQDAWPLNRQAESAVQVIHLFRTFPVFTWIGIGTAALLPLLAVLTAVVFRGGLRHRLLGVEVVRLDGRPAGRLRCGWRALVAWLPPFALLMAARYLDDTFWAYWTPSSDMTMTTVIVPALQILTGALIAVMLLAAVAWPTRAPHDRLAGTCLVPA